MVTHIQGVSEVIHSTTCIINDNFEDMNMEECVLDELPEQITCRDVSYEDIESCVGNSNSFVGQFHDKLNELRDRGPGEFGKFHE